MRFWGIVAVIGIGLMLPQAHARELFNVNTSIRALGMGNAYTAAARDSDAIFYNPAGLADFMGIRWTIMDPRIGASGLEAYEAIQDIQGSDSFEESVRELYGKRVWVGAGAKSMVSLPFVSLAVYDSLDASLNVENPAYPNLDINAVNDFGYLLGFGLPILPVLHAGLVFKRIKRIGSRVPFGPSFVGSLDPDTIMENVQKEGTGYGLDAGANFIIPAPFIDIVVSGVWKNIGGMSFRHDSGNTPPSERDEMILASSVLIDLPLVSITPSVDFRYLNHSDVQLGKKLNFGVELGLPLIDVRAGFHQGYYTLGVGVSLGLLRVEAATWGVEMGEYPGQDEDRRYALQVSLELGFDVGSGSLVGGSSGRSGSRSGSWGGRRLKQRR